VQYLYEVTFKLWPKLEGKIIKIKHMTVLLYHPNPHPGQQASAAPPAPKVFSNITPSQEDVINISNHSSEERDENWPSAPCAPEVDLAIITGRHCLEIRISSALLRRRKVIVFAGTTLGA
jgi:hypothetical protein